MTFFQHSIYNIDQIQEKPEVVTMFDVIEHLSDQRKVIQDIYNLLPQGGFLVISTDKDDSIWLRPSWNRVYRLAMNFSRSGRSCLLIQRVESYRRTYVKDYHLGHIGLLTCEALQHLLDQAGMKTSRSFIGHMIDVPIISIVERFFPKSLTGTYQIMIAQKSQLSMADE